jgi:hypothetical protein
VEKEAGFQWSSEGDPDFTFLVSFRDPEAVTVTAEAHRDLFGLVMTSLSNVPKISIEAIAEHELGRKTFDFKIKIPGVQSVAQSRGGLCRSLKPKHALIPCLAGEPRSATFRASAARSAEARTDAP